MAHFKRGNLQLKTNQQIQLGDSQESLIKYDGTDLLLKPSSGAVELYFDGTKVVETTTTGIKAGVAVFDIKTSGGEDGITINSDGSVELFYDNVKTFETTTDGASVTGNLTVSGNLTIDGTTGVLLEYSLVTGERDFTGTVGGVDPVSATDFVTLQYMVTLGTDRQRLFWPLTGSDATDNLEISIERLVDVKHVDFDIDHVAPPWQEGRVFWDQENNTFGVYNDVPAVTLQVGQETHIKVRNESGVLIPDGTVCYIVGASAERALILPAIATTEPTSEGIVVATHDISNGEDGYGTIIGRVGSQDTSAFGEGSEIYLSPFVAGAITDVRPTAPHYVVDIGSVIVSDSSEGSLLIQILNHGDFASLADVNIDPTPTNGQTLVYNESNTYWQPETQVKIISYTLPLAGVSDAQVPLTGTFVTKATGQTGDDAVNYTISNQHIWLLINSVTLSDSTGTITITGTSVSESTGLTVTSDTEVIYIDSTADTYYQTDKKWWEITNVDIGADIVAIDYDHGALGYADMSNRDFKITGYRMDAFSAGNSPDMRLIITKVNDLGDKKVEFINLEDIGVDSGSLGDQIVDHVRTGGSDRSYDPGVADIWLDDETFTFKQIDFDTYWSGENEIFSSTLNSGFLIRIEGEPDATGITNVDFIDLLLYYALL
jgi:hypothetical protein